MLLFSAKGPAGTIGSLMKPLLLLCPQTVLSKANISIIHLLLSLQALTTCPCRGLGPTSPPTCPVAPWTCHPAATGPWVGTTMPCPRHRVCPLKARWTWAKANQWETTAHDPTWTCSPIKVLHKAPLCKFFVPYWDSYSHFDRKLISDGENEGILPVVLLK